MIDKLEKNIEILLIEEIEATNTNRVIKYNRDDKTIKDRYANKVIVCDRINKIVIYKKKEATIKKILQDLSELFYKKKGFPITTADLVKKSYGFGKAEKFYEKVVTRHLYPEKDRSRGSKPEPKLINLTDENLIYPLALSLKIVNNHKNIDRYDFTSIDDFYSNFEQVSKKVIVNICINKVTLNELMRSFYNEDKKIVLNVLINIAHGLDIKKDESIYHSLDDLKADILSGLKEFKEINFRNLSSRNQNFVGRKLLLNDINDSLSSCEGKSVAIVVLSGLGGVGKSQLALEYAYEYNEDTNIIWWLRAETPEDLESDYLRLEEYLKIPFKKDIKKEDRITVIRCKLEKRRDWLLIFDNASSMEGIDNYLPRTKAGRVLVTSRNPGWYNVTKVIKVDVFTRSESIACILRYLLRDEKNKQVADELEIEADKLAVELGNLPLALTQASAYIKNGSTISEYLELFKKYKIDIFKEKESKVENYFHTVETTWSISIEAVEKSCPEGVYLLNLCAFMAPEGIPIKLIKEASNYLSLNGIKIFSTRLEINRAISSLTDYSLIQRENSMLSVHRLVQLVTRNNIEDKMNIWIGALIKTINAILPDDINIRENRDIYYNLLPHLSNIIRLAEENSIRDKNIDEDMRLIISKVESFLFNTSDFKRHIEYQEKFLKICQEIGDQKREADCYTKLGTDYNRLGDYQKDKEYQEKSLKICQEIDYKEGEANCYTNLGKAFHNLCDFWKAIKYQNESLKIWEEIGDRLGKANCHINLGVAYYRLGYFIEDIKYQNESLKIWEGIGDRQGKSKCYTNLGNAYLSLGNFEDAVKYQKDSLNICLEIGDRQGELTCYNNLGVAYHTIGYYKKNIESLENAKDNLNKSIKICQEIGDREGETKCYGNLGNVYLGLENFEDAIECQNDSLKICLEISDRQGESVCYNNLGNVYYCIGNFKYAIEYQEKSLKICQEIGDRQGELKCYTSFGKVYRSLGDDKNAKVYEEKSQEIDIEIVNRQDELKCYTILGDIYNRLS